MRRLERTDIQLLRSGCLLSSKTTTTTASLALHSDLHMTSEVHGHYLCLMIATQRYFSFIDRISVNQQR